MKRVASLYLPDWPIERIVLAARDERTAMPPDAAAPTSGVAAAPRPAPRGGGWRPGARWARTEDAAPPHAPRHPAPERRAVPGAGSEAAPLVTGIQQGNALVIAAVDAAARARGIVPGMAVTQARALVPGLDIRAADPAGDRAALHRLAVLAARRWCPLVAVSDDADDWGLFLDLTGTAHLFGGEVRMARRIVRLLARAGYCARVAVADTPGAAWALARFCGPAVCVIPPATHVAAIAPLPVAALRLNSRARDLLERLGIDTVAQLAALPRAPLMRRFGGVVIARLDQASGRLPEPLDPVVPPEHVAVVQRFAEPILTGEAIAHWLDRLVPLLTARLGEAGRGARMIELVVERIDGRPQVARLGVARASRDPAHLKRLLLRRIEAIDPGFGIDALALHVRRSEPLGAEPFVERLDGDAAPDLAPLVDTLGVRIGPDRLWRICPVDSDVPERSIAPGAVLDPPPRAAPGLKPDDVRQLERAADLHPWHRRWPRPVRLLRRPELLDHVLAELPDQPPRRFTWRGTAHRVVRADGPERICGEWWKRASERDSIRDYFRVEDEAGQRFWLFRRGDGLRGETGDLAWFMHGSFG